jgi:hypothetical protein
MDEKLAFQFELSGQSSRSVWELICRLRLEKRPIRLDLPRNLKLERSPIILGEVTASPRITRPAKCVSVRFSGRSRSICF